MAHRLTLLLFGLALTTAAPPAHASGSPPVTQPDAVTVMIDSRDVPIDLAANDVDPEGDFVWFGGTEGTIPGVRVMSHSATGADQDVTVHAWGDPRESPDGFGAVPGTYQIRTAMHDGGSSIVLTTLTITLLPPLGDAVSLTKNRRPGRVLVHNDNDTAVRFLWGADHHRRADGAVDVPAHSSVRIEVRRRSVVTLVLAGAEFDVGLQRHLEPPRGGGALPPGVEPGLEHFDVSDTKWVQRAI
jgi:hypothetical protein